MGMPSSHLEGLYRNPMEEVQRFLNTRHTAHYKVYNLCEERSYPKNSFFKQEIFPFKDHEAPPLNLMKSFCEDAKKFLDEDKKNIVAVHCKAGKGRTGTMICCLLLYMNTFETAAECLQYYGMMRAENGKGVTIPSQIRYVNYFEKIIKEKMPHPVVFIKKIITKIRMFTLPMFHKVYTPYFKIENNGMEYSSEKKKTDFKKEDLFALVDFDIEKGFLVEGDVKVTFYRDKLLKKKKIFLNFGLIQISYLMIAIFINLKKKKLIRLVKIKSVNIIHLDLKLKYILLMLNMILFSLFYFIIYFYVLNILYFN